MSAPRMADHQSPKVWDTWHPDWPHSKFLPLRPMTFSKLLKIEVQTLRLRNVAWFMGLLLFISTLSHSHLSRFSTAFLTPNGESGDTQQHKGRSQGGEEEEPGGESLLGHLLPFLRHEV